MFRLTFALTAFAFAATSAAAATYSAMPATPASGKLIARDIVWTCTAAAGCQGSTQEGRAVVRCQSLAKRTGRIDSFAVDGRAFAAAELERCNSVAKGPPAKALAAH
jgi:hypothetical protein